MQKFAGNTIEEAIEQACVSLKTDQKNLKYQVVQKPKRGFLGIGRRSAVIRATVTRPVTQIKKSRVAGQKLGDFYKQGESGKSIQKSSTEDSARDEKIISRENFAKNLAKMAKASQGLQQYIGDVLKNLGISGHLEIEKAGAHDCHAKLVTPYPNRVIGYHGRRINALEELGAAYLNYHGVKDVQFFLNCGDYRQQREKSLKKLMNDSITQVIASNRAVFLDPMPAHERKILHKLGAASGKVKTYSHGREPYRSVVIAPK